MKFGLLGFLLGLAVGISGMVLIPRFASSYLPPAMKPGVSVKGIVVAKQRDPERLLVTLSAPEGSILVTFTKKVPEIDLLVEKTDALTLSMGGYRPFIQNPEIERVQKQAPQNHENSSATESTGNLPDPQGKE